MSDFIGPVIPSNKEDSNADEYIGPKLPKKDRKDSSDIKETYGPALPPDLIDQNKIIGPTLPPVTPNQTDYNEKDERCFIGPIPSTNTDYDELQLLERQLKRNEIDSRSRMMKEKLNPHGETSTHPTREEWMLNLPPEINPAIGVSMTSRKFRTKYVDTGDRSVWTDTPEEKAKKALAQERKESDKTDPVQETISKRDQELKKAIEQYNKEHRSDSLVDMHRKRKAEDDCSGSIRKPFNRETDLQLPENIITDSKRKLLIRDSSKSLDSKFSHGKQHFL